MKIHTNPCAYCFLLTNQALSSISQRGNTNFYCLLVVALNLILHLLRAYRASASWAPGARSIFFPFSSLFHFFMPFCYSIYYYILPISPLTSSFLFFTCFFFLIFVICCLLKLSSLLGWSLSCLKIKNVLAGQVSLSHSLTRGMSCSLSPFSWFPPPCFFFRLPWFLCVVSLLCFPLVAITMAHSFYAHSLSLPFLHLLSSFTPYTLPFHIAIDRKGTTGLLI